MTSIQYWFADVADCKMQGGLTPCDQGFCRPLQDEEVNEIIGTLDIEAYVKSRKRSDLGDAKPERITVKFGDECVFDSDVKPIVITYYCVVADKKDVTDFVGLGERYWRFLSVWDVKALPSHDFADTEDQTGHWKYLTPKQATSLTGLSILDTYEVVRQIIKADGVKAHRVTLSYASTGALIYDTNKVKEYHSKLSKSFDIYVCGRIREKAIPAIVKTLRDSGLKVFSPMEQEYNLTVIRVDKNYPELTRDIICAKRNVEAMRNSCMLLCVGKMGTDCSFEVGWAVGVGKSICWLETDEEQLLSPMVDYEINRGRLGNASEVIGYYKSLKRMRYN